MKKLNSIGYGHRILGITLVFLVVLAVCFYLLFVFFRAAITRILAYVSIGIGIVISVCFALLLTIEFHQDGKLDRWYTTTLWKTKMRTGNGIYECQACGSRQVGAADSACKVCGIKFYQEKVHGHDNSE